MIVAPEKFQYIRCEFAGSKMAVNNSPMLKLPSSINTSLDKKFLP
jgi:hypothetical protein